MALLEVDTAQILELIKQLPLDSKRSILEALQEDVVETPSSTMPEINAETEMDTESQIWLEASLTDDLPEYDWGPEGIPEGIPVKCIDGKGVIVSEVSAVES